MEFRSQSQRLQDEMAEDVERLQDQLTEAEGEVDQVRANLVALTRQAYDDREKYDLRMNTAEAKSRELERKLGASSVEGGTLSATGFECRPCRVRETQLSGRRRA
jgi:TolA-binding protein